MAVAAHPQPALAANAMTAAAAVIVVAALAAVAALADAVRGASAMISA